MITKRKEISLKIEKDWKNIEYSINIDVFSHLKGLFGLKNDIFVYSWSFF